MFNFLNVTSCLPWIRHCLLFNCFYQGPRLDKMPAISTLLVANNSGHGTSHLLFHVSCLFKHLVAGHESVRSEEKMVCLVLEVAVAWLPVMCRSHATGQHMGNSSRFN